MALDKTINQRENQVILSISNHKKNQPFQGGFKKPYS